MTSVPKYAIVTSTSEDTFAVRAMISPQNRRPIMIGDDQNQAACHYAKFEGTDILYGCIPWVNSRDHRSKFAALRRRFPHALIISSGHCSVLSPRDAGNGPEIPSLGSVVVSTKVSRADTPRRLSNGSMHYPNNLSRHSCPSNSSKLLSIQAGLLNAGWRSDTFDRILGKFLKVHEDYLRPKEEETFFPQDQIIYLENDKTELVNGERLKVHFILKENVHFGKFASAREQVSCVEWRDTLRDQGHVCVDVGSYDIWRSTGGVWIIKGVSNHADGQDKGKYVKYACASSAAACLSIINVLEENLGA